MEGGRQIQRNHQHKGWFPYPFGKLKILYKKYGLLGLRGWRFKSKIIADGSVDTALDGRHYSRGTRLYKQTFETLVCFKCKSVENKFQLNFTSKVKKLKEETTQETYWLFLMMKAISK